jgi:predicted HTH transcriptional regulator
MQVKLILHIEHKTDGPKNGPKNDPKNGPKKITDRQRDILKALSEDNTLTREQLSQKLGISESTIKRELNFMKKNGCIEREGGKTYGRWIIKIEE